jgi:hypothetical protein
MVVEVKEKFEEIKGVIRNRKWKDRQCNGQKRKDKRTYNNLQNATQKISKNNAIFWDVVVQVLLYIFFRYNNGLYRAID